jgi:hypothetical protein
VLKARKDGKSAAHQLDEERVKKAALQHHLDACQVFIYLFFSESCLGGLVTSA